MKKFNKLIYVHVDCRGFFKEESFTNFSLKNIESVKIVLVKNEEEEITLIVLPLYKNHVDGVIAYMEENNLDSIIIMGGAWMIVKPSSEIINIFGASVSFPKIDQSVLGKLLSLVSDRYITEFNLLEAEDADPYFAHHTRDSLEKLAREAR